MNHYFNFAAIRFLPFCFMLGILSPTHARATVKKPVILGQNQDHKFPIPNIVAEQVWFWENIFEKFGSTSIVLHDPMHPHLIIDVINLPYFEQKHNGGRPFTKDKRNDLVDKYVSRYLLAMDRVAKEGQKALQYGAMERRILSVYSTDKDALADLMARRSNIRTQQGLADEFREAALRAEPYMPIMEGIFKEQKLPVDLTRIVFVESMFNTKAISKVGASGVWQFMPGTARDFMMVNNYIDERNSPTKATRAAAKFMTSNFDTLRSWPLAITAYNHGAGSMKKAQQKLRTNDIGKIIEKYDAPSFGFASRNFYAEFLAAKNVYNRKFLPERKATEDAYRITHIKFSRPTTLAEIFRFGGLDTKVIEQYNPCLLPAGLERFKHRPLPPNYELVVPRFIAERLTKGAQSPKTNQSNTKTRRYRL